MTKRKVYFRADASADIGYGHFIRSLALADMLKDDFECIFFTQNPSEYQKNEAENVCKLVELPCDNSKFENFLSYLQGDEIVVLDNYFYTTEYQKLVKGKGCKLVCIDDLHDKHFYADLIVNHGVNDKSLYENIIEPYSKLCLGLEYSLLRRPFLLQSSIKTRNEDIVVCFGGADPLRLTDRVVSMLLKIAIPYNIKVILGEKVYLSDENRKRVDVLSNLRANQMAMLFDQSSAGIFSASTVCIEALSRNLPIIAGFYVDNQYDFYRMLEQNGYIIPLGQLQNVTTGRLENAVEKLKIFVSKHLERADIASNIIKAFRSI
ncbi:UDP-2,4-diacetamido-2,4,6-trideoxy-beta-L-altropyranose hydrolase [Bacteroides heparinolyticus]|uniref:UDP-2,4-diacetamido-2,4, 6-trideoxy-beta-L-altropyranose hydrolase n=1 Tax=Prevotella heparinolytica TaxID=28113 RepID=A0A2R3MUJ3_9BACE|nr:UDP-2,4-diacetamido-2,4,6-trideoxy-beta-L-altropyranose hydrolase [Bacteroides heparinolyticus]AVM58651.1 UDP-2,4-diacetamido-2,4,6-trideoxy-beta-L-altropyranose hydrolase [Bacteroides heparinolyticus]TCO88935.1 UDP-2,4-diacetamido-2,4,6-trideoxy-beta-L-altropyranose hydrolase [Bacteroides heparinolyticus]